MKPDAEQTRDRATMAGERCPACGEPSLLDWREASASDRTLARASSYRLLRCGACGSASLADAGAEGQALYEEGAYAPARGSLARPLTAAHSLFTRDRRRLLGELTPGSRILEIGAGRGRLVADLAARGHHAVGIEPATAAAAAARKEGARVETRGLEQASFEAGSLDLVVLWHVLEHLADPAAALDRISPWLAPGGRMVVAVPNLASLQARMGGDRWFHQDVPRHRTQFTAKGLRRLLERSGWRTIRVRQLMLDQSQHGMWLTLLNRLTSERDVPFRFVKRDLRYARRRDAVRDAVVTLGLGAPLLAIAVPLELGAAALGRGGAVVIEAAPG